MSTRERIASDLEESLAQQVVDEIGRRSGPVDVVDRIEERLMEIRERVLTRAYPEILRADPSFYEDPNPIAHHEYPSVDLTPGHTGGPITPVDLARRSPYRPDEFARLRGATVGFVGCGGIQLCAELLTRAGIGRLILADHDRFESTNASRQAFCTEETLGLNKAAIAGQHLTRINAALDVVAHEVRVMPDDLPGLFGEAQVLVDGSGDVSLRTGLHSYARRASKPLVTWAWAGWEGQCMTFLPDDPLYYDIFDFSPHTNDRGFDVAGLCVLNGCVARDVLNLLLGYRGRLSAYPYLTTFSSLRRHFTIVRDVRAIRGRHQQCRPTPG